ncbi:cytidine deaminase [Romboutsia weinsteinii]|uniref:Cytidine deaminase n=1 Tax=Romboutsia weinsteinii TaxID=2020949 RepID=A0A371IYT2_9FIRM|nr:cytidine deaminase [Romboutsia weinsteinii]RDY25637.1 cytidine deaminase [Romboutsia weinsteinii]
MEKLMDKDLELINRAKEVIGKNYDKDKFKHTVGSAVRCKSGNIYVGVNVYTVSGACAEMIAIGSAISSGERDFDCIVAVLGEQGEEVLPPCGNCRQLLNDYMLGGDVIINTEVGLMKAKVQELLPYAYCVEG